MEELKALGTYFRENPAAIAATLCGLVAGGVLGALAFFNGWLG